MTEERLINEDVLLKCHSAAPGLTVVQLICPKTHFTVQTWLRRDVLMLSLCADPFTGDLTPQWKNKASSLPSTKRCSYHGRGLKTPDASLIPKGKFIVCLFTVHM